MGALAIAAACSEPTEPVPGTLPGTCDGSACADEGGPPAPDATTPDASEPGCTLVRRYRDADGDGYGAGELVDVCVDATGYAEVDGDCADEDERAHPGQTEPQEGLVTGPGGGDFDCDGAEEPSETTVGFCSSFCRTGWRGDVAPCGTTRSYILSCNVASPTICTPVTESRAQKCL